MKISFLIPVYNEERTVAEVIDRVCSLPFAAELIVIDDGSTDGTAEILAQLERRHEQVTVIREPHRGKGAALQAGIARVSGEITVIQDADLEYDPADVPALIEPIRRGSADVVFGSRLSGGRPQRAYLFWHMVGNKLLSLITGVLYNTTLTDIETGYKAFRTDVLRAMNLRENDFAIEAEITAKACKQHLRVYEIPVAYYGRTAAEGKTIGWRDGLRALWVLTRLRLQP